MASILLNEPIAAAGLGLDPGRAQGALGRAGREPLQPSDRRLRQRHPPGPPPRRASDEYDWKVPRVHAMLETHIRGEQKPLLATCGRSRPAARSNEVWNHGIVQVRLRVQRDPGPRATRRPDRDRSSTPTPARCSTARITRTGSSTTSTAWSTVWTAGSTRRNPARGRLDARSAARRMFAPLNILEVVESRWAGHNPYVTEANVRALDLANGGATMARFRSSPPQFRTVLEYESGPRRWSPAAWMIRTSSRATAMATAGAAACSAVCSGVNQSDRPPCPPRALPAPGPTRGPPSTGGGPGAGLLFQWPVVSGGRQPAVRASGGG